MSSKIQTMAISDIRKSISAVFEERLTSPFYGSFFFSWAVWNWKIIYLTLFVNSETITPLTKIQYIDRYYFNWLYLLVFPLLSAGFLITVVPWLANKLYKVSLYYEKQRRLEKEKHDSEKRLSIEESMLVKKDLFDQTERHQRLLTAKDVEVAQIKTEVETHIGEKAIFKKQLEDEQTEKRKFKILYASYGKDDQVGDVTTQTSLLLEQNKKFTVNNVDLNGDPASGIYKDYFVIYQTDGNIVPLRAKEHDLIELKGNILNATQSDISRSVQNSANAENLARMFPGKWKLTYSGDINGNEIIEIKNNGQYFASAASNHQMGHIFNLEEITIDKNIGQFEFTKVGAQPHDSRRLKNHLRIIEKMKLYEGTEHEGRRQVSYRKLD